eukprot:9976011-Ditylum_brightwellii.AAC.1
MGAGFHLVTFGSVLFCKTENNTAFLAFATSKTRASFLTMGSTIASRYECFNMQMINKWRLGFLM